MKPIDFILLLPLFFGVYDGYKKGFLLIIVGFLAYIFGIAGAFRLTQEGIDFLIVFFPQMPKILPFLSFIFISLLISVGIYLLGILVKKGLNFTVFAGNLDNVMGALVGFCQWVFMLSIVVWLIKQSNFVLLQSYTQDSLIFNYLDTLAPKVIEKLDFLMPFADHLFQSIKQIFKEL
ncbi:MAG: CvpA family protein [Cytophagales bacterium]